MRIVLEINRKDLIDDFSEIISKQFLLFNENFRFDFVINKKICNYRVHRVVVALGMCCWRVAKLEQTSQNSHQNYDNLFTIREIEVNLI